MADARSFPTRGVLHRPKFSAVDVAVFVAMAVLLSVSCASPTT